MPCALASPGSLTEALVCSDKAKAAQQLYDLACIGPQVPAAIEVRQVWRSRESLPADSAARDILIQTLMAKCLVEASLEPNSLERVDPSALSFLRSALTNSNPGVAITAMLGLVPALTKGDVATIVKIVSTHEDLAFPAVMALGESCLVEAHVGIVSIRSAYSGRQRNDIDKYMAEPGVQDLPDVCSGKKVRIPQSVIAKAMNLPPVTEFRHQSSNATQVKAALDSPDPNRGLQTLLDVQCTPEHAGVVDEIRKAWRGRGTPGNTLVSDRTAQAVIARCLIQADFAVTAEKAEITEAASILRSAIHGDDVMAVMVAVDGLAIIGADEDVARIAEVPRRIPTALNAVVRSVGFTCGASNLKTLALMRKEAATDEMRDRIDAVYKHVEPTREQTCGKGK